MLCTSVSLADYLHAQTNQRNTHWTASPMSFLWWKREKERKSEENKEKMHEKVNTKDSSNLFWRKNESITQIVHQGFAHTQSTKLRSYCKSCHMSMPKLIIPFSFSKDISSQTTCMIFICSTNWRPLSKLTEIKRDVIGLSQWIQIDIVKFE